MKKIFILLLILFGSINLFSQQVINSKLQVNGDLQFGPTVSPGSWVRNWGYRIWFSHMDDNTDPLYMARFNKAQDESELRVSIGDTSDGRDKFAIGYTRLSDSNFTPVFSVQADGKVGILTNTPQYALDVYGTISAAEIIVAPKWADFVFEKDYKLPTLKEVEQHIAEKGTLPNVPSEKEIKDRGMNIAETNALLLQKIEELTLYILQQEKRIEAMESKINN